MKFKIGDKVRTTRHTTAVPYGIDGTVVVPRPDTGSVETYAVAWSSGEYPYLWGYKDEDLEHADNGLERILRDLP